MFRRQPQQLNGNLANIAGEGQAEAAHAPVCLCTTGDGNTSRPGPSVLSMLSTLYSSGVVRQQVRLPSQITFLASLCQQHEKQHSG